MNIINTYDPIIIKNLLKVFLQCQHCIVKNIQTSPIPTNTISLEIFPVPDLEKYVLMYYDWLKSGCHLFPGESIFVCEKVFWVIEGE